MRYLIIAVLLLFNLQQFCSAQKPGQKGYLEVAAIPFSNSEERIKKFSEYSIEEQIDIYIYSQNTGDTKRLHFIIYLASDGEKKIPAILKRIDADPVEDPITKFYLICVLEAIDNKCQCLKNSDLEILSRNEMRANETDVEAFRGYKELYSKVLKEIKARHQ